MEERSKVSDLALHTRERREETADVAWGYAASRREGASRPMQLC